MPETVLAAQMYTVREFCKTPKGIAESLKKVRAMGYKAAQLSGLGPIETDELKRICDGEGLTICATHVKFAELRDDTEAQIEYHKALGCDNPAIGGLPGDCRGSGEGFARFAKEADQVGEKLAKAGLTFSYHNHSFELERLDGRVGLDIIYGGTRPETLKAEIDTYWIQHGGGDPAAWIDKLSDRIVLLHLKDMTMHGTEQFFAEVGEGNMNWERILEAARNAGTRWYIVEQDRCERDPFESLEISLKNLKDMGLS